MAISSVLIYLHLFFVVVWAGSLLLLLKDFVNYAQSGSEISSAQFKITERNFYFFATPSLVVGVGTGLWQWLSFGFDGPWMMLMYKFFLALVYVIYHVWFWRYLANFRAGRNIRSQSFFRRFRVLFIVLWAGILPLAVPSLWGY